jgi:uncharacterized protein YxeA
MLFAGMNRTIALLAVCFSIFTAAAADAGRQYYELRVYTTKSEQQQKQVSDYWQNSAIPAYNRMGVKSVGVFTELNDSPTNHIYVLIPFESADAFAGSTAKLAGDAKYQKASADFMAIPKNDAPYVKFDSSLLIAFTGMTQLALPPSTAEKKPWIFELRTYYSHNEAKGINKVDMFNAGEIEVMKQVGLSPVFFAQAVLGEHLPNLTYMVSGENMDEHKKHWGGFGSNAIWKKLSGDPQYKDNVSGIKNTFLKRTPASQI